MIFIVLILCLSNFSAKAQIQDSLLYACCDTFPESTQIAIAFVEKDTVLFRGYQKTVHGFEAILNQNICFEIGSLTKVFNSYLLAKGITEETLKAEQPVHKLIKCKIKHRPKISLLSLSNHSSGLPRLPENMMPLLRKEAANPYKNYTASMLTDYLKTECILQNPGSFEYSNLGAALLGYAIAKNSKKTYEACLKDAIFEPLKMTNSSTKRSILNNEITTPGLNYGFNNSYWDFDVLAPAGAIVSTLEDLSLFLSYQLYSDDASVKLQQKSSLTVNDALDIAMGWFILKQDDGSILFHNGRTAGFSSAMAINTQKNKGVIILSNVSGLNPIANRIDALCLKLTD